MKTKHSNGFVSSGYVVHVHRMMRKQYLRLDVAMAEEIRFSPAWFSLLETQIKIFPESPVKIIGYNWFVKRVVDLKYYLLKLDSNRFLTMKRLGIGPQFKIL
jgi:hypothetical protein